MYYPDRFFQSVQSYSRLCLESFFYETFKKYKYMLIYQTDAFVFRDNLKKFCDMNYDYVGAPWPWWFAREFPMRCKHRVGNGGFSLRRIDTALKILRHKQEILRNCSFSQRLLDAEDLFWTYCDMLGIESFHVPDEVTALSFSTEGFQEKWLSRCKKETLPFGCHSWSMPARYGTWKKWIESAGYNLPAISSKQIGSQHLRYHRLHLMRNYLISRCKKNSHGFHLKNNFWSLWRMIYFSVIMRCIKLHIIKFN